MAKSKKTIQETIFLNSEVQKMVSYTDYFTYSPLFTSLQIKNTGSEVITDLELSLSNSKGLIIDTNKEIVEVPYESALEIDTGNILSPAYFVSIEQPTEEEINLTLKHGKNVLADQKLTVTALPFDYWQGFFGNTEQLACFVRPKLADCSKLRIEIEQQLKKWNTSFEMNGYEATDKNTIRQVIAALFACIRHHSITKVDCNISAPVRAGGGVKILAEKQATTLEMALFACACLESMQLHPILLLGEQEITVGVWLYNSCFADTVADDLGRIKNYVTDGINNLSCFDVADLFSDRNVAYTSSEKHFVQKLNLDTYDKFIDIKRCRLAQLLPLPIKVRNARGYELLKEHETSPDTAPKALKEAVKLSVDTKLTKDKQWERRLLDLSMKNTLLNFKPDKDVLHIYSADADTTMHVFNEKMEMTLECRSISDSKNVVPYFGASVVGSAVKELIALEENSGIMRSYSNKSSFDETTSRFVKKSKEADEESGTKILYLAYGFLKWFSKEETNPKFAPLVLQSINLKKLKNGNYVISPTDEEPTINATLLEFLKQEFDIDIRGLDGKINGLKMSELFAMIRMEIVNMKNWEVYDDVYLSTFSFARYQMWQDVRKNMKEFSKNPIIDALLNNKPYAGPQEDLDVQEDQSPINSTLVPLPADSSQWDAIALSQKGQTFVLHGPPGTGKSQTITNIIANALNENKRVLFVAEKQAALSVVKKRLDAIGIGEFCLELHSAKSTKAEVLQKLQNVLALADSKDEEIPPINTTAIENIRTSLMEPFEALHKKRRLGVSIYQAMLIYLKNKTAPEIMNIESSFYDSLTKEKIAQYESMIVKAVVAAKECGGVYSTPFTNVNLTKYSPQLRDSIYCSAEVMIAEIKHLKNYVALFLDIYRQQISVLTRAKLETLKNLSQLLAKGALNKYFAQDEEEFYTFFNANLRLDHSYDYYFKRFKKLIDVSKDYKTILTLIDNQENIFENALCKKLIAKLEKIAIRPIPHEEWDLVLQNLCTIYEAIATIKSHTNLSKNFTTSFKTDFFEGRKKFMADLYKVHDLCRKLFMDFNPDGFNSACIRALNGYAKPALNGLHLSICSFEQAEESFLTITNADKSLIPEDDLLEYYTSKAGALIDNIDMLGSWCDYRENAQNLDKAGLSFITDALENGAVNGESVISSFQKNIYRNFLQINIPLDPALAKFSASIMDENAESLRLLMDDFSKITRANLRQKLIKRIPTVSTEGSLSLELVNFQRYAKNNLRGMGIRKLLAEIPELSKVIAPCMLMSPITVAQYLQPESDLFDLVIFDEASQMPTSEAIGSLSRAKCAIVVGDPKQLPPTAFFNASYVDEENLENEDMESVLDDCLALGFPERKLTWHYRSHHESLIAFSNIMYYGNKLCTFPSPDALDSKVKFVRVPDAFYDRGFSKRNTIEADALVEEVIKRLSDPVKNRSSLGIVTFSTVQKEYIERKLSTLISQKHLEEAAYDRDEPIFVKNLENVQGDERDVILFSVCYGPDRLGRVSLNFGPLNQMGGWRRLNVAVSRAREEMVVFTSMTSAMIDLSKTNSKGVAGLKAFLEYAEKGRTNIAIPAENITTKRQSGIGKYIAQELSSYGYECRYDVGVSDFKIDVAVVDPKNKHKFILAVVCDGNHRFSTKDRNILQVQTLKRNNWNVLRLYSVNYYNNPKREIKKIKDLLDKLTGADKHVGSGLNKYKRPYKYVSLPQKFENVNYVNSGENDAEIITRLKAIVAAEEPISEKFLIKRCLSTLGIAKYGSKVESRMVSLIALCGFKHEKLLNNTYYRKTDKANVFNKYRVEEGSEILRKTEFDFTPYEIIAIICGALEDKVALYGDEMLNIVCRILRVSQSGEKMALFINSCITLGEERGLFVRSVSDRISLA